MSSFLKQFCYRLSRKTDVNLKLNKKDEREKAKYRCTSQWGCRLKSKRRHFWIRFVVRIRRRRRPTLVSGLNELRGLNSRQQVVDQLTLRHCEDWKKKVF